MVERRRAVVDLVFEEGDVRVWRIDRPAGERSGATARRQVRSVLANATGVGATPVRLSVDERGKPHLRDNVLDTRFSVSHAPGVSVVAVARHRAVGVDVEAVVPDFDDAGLVAGLFSEHERAQLEALSCAQRLAAFFACWVRKEAYLKATGEGLSGGLAHFDVSVSPDEPARLLAVHGHPGEAARWTLRDVDLGPAYAAALAVRGPSPAPRPRVPPPPPEIASQMAHMRAIWDARTVG